MRNQETSDRTKNWSKYLIKETCRMKVKLRFLAPSAEIAEEEKT